jgi:hypothetical protein
MSDLSKLDARIAIESRLADVKSALKNLDTLEAKAQKLEAELLALKANEADILNDLEHTDEEKLPSLLQARGLIDLKQSAVDNLRGRPAQGNEKPAISGKVTLAQEVVARAGDAVQQFLQAWHDATLMTFKRHVGDATAAFINPKDIDELMVIAGRHPVVRQIQMWVQPFFLKDHLRGWNDAVHQARSLEPIWDNLLATSDAIPGDFEPVSVPHTWL